MKASKSSKYIRLLYNKVIKEVKKNAKLLKEEEISDDNKQYMVHFIYLNL